MNVREFDLSDKNVFFELCKCFYNTESTVRSYSEEITEKTFSRIMDRHENLWGFMLTDNNTLEVIGYALITSYWCNEEGGDVIVLDELFIKPVNRNKGYGHLFMSWLESRFKDAAAITLEVLTTNQRACSLYDKVGYRPDGYLTYTKSLKKE